MMKPLLAGAWLVLAATALAEPPRRPEVFLNYGVLRWGGDEGSPGTGSAWGGTGLVALTPRVAIELDVFTARREGSGEMVRSVTGGH
jgi:hypothetical protein